MKWQMLPQRLFFWFCSLLCEDHTKNNLGCHQHASKGSSNELIHPNLHGNVLEVFSKSRFFENTCRLSFLYWKCWVMAANRPSPGSFCSACKVLQHLLEVRVSTDKHQHATWLNTLEENQNTDSSTTLYCSISDTTTVHSSSHKGHWSVQLFM